jgi:hypothetical protein
MEPTSRQPRGAGLGGVEAVGVVPLAGEPVERQRAAGRLVAGADVAVGAERELRAPVVGEGQRLRAVEGDAP